MKVLFSSLIIFFIWVNHCNADAGCLVGSSIFNVETTPVVGVTIAADLVVYQTSGLPTSCFSGTISTSKACFVCGSGGRVVLVVGATPLLYIVTCEGFPLGYLATRGTYYSDFTIDCPLDDYTWLIALTSGTFGLIIIRRRIK